jgi:hypothetical protein
LADLFRGLAHNSRKIPGLGKPRADSATVLEIARRSIRRHARIAPNLGGQRLILSVGRLPHFTAVISTPARSGSPTAAAAPTSTQTGASPELIALRPSSRSAQTAKPWVTSASSLNLIAALNALPSVRPAELAAVSVEINAQNPDRLIAMHAPDQPDQARGSVVAK